MPLDNPYQPPADSDVIAQSTFSQDEWRYIAKIFSAWLIAVAILVALYITTQMFLSLSQFGGENYLGRVLALAIPAQYGAALVIMAASNTFVMVMERRSKQKTKQLPPRFPWWIVLFLTIVTPLTIAFTLAASQLSSALLFGISLGATWTSMRQGIHWEDIGRASFAVFSTSIILVLIASRIAQILHRFAGWLILKVIVVGQVFGLLVFMIQSVAKMF
jgi:hypothetical protein